MAEPRGRSGGTNRDTGASRPAMHSPLMRAVQQFRAQDEPESEPTQRPRTPEREQPGLTDQEKKDLFRGRRPDLGPARERVAKHQGDSMDRIFRAGNVNDPRKEFLPDFDAEAAFRILERLSRMSVEGVDMMGQRTNRLAERLGMTPQPFWETLGRPTPAWATAPSINPNDSSLTKLKKYIQDKLLGYTGEEN